MNPDNYPNITRLLDNVGKIDDVERAITDVFTRKDMDTFDRYLSTIDFDRDRYAVWGEMLRNGQEMSMFAEITLVHHLRQRHGMEKVSIHENIGTDSPDSSVNFDVHVNLDGTHIWIEVTYENLEKKLEEHTFRAYSPKMTGFQIDDKIEKDFEPARQVARDSDVLVLAIYLEGPFLQWPMIEKRLHEGGKYEMQNFVDGVMGFENFWNPRSEYCAFTEAGESVRDALALPVK